MAIRWQTCVATQTANKAATADGNGMASRWQTDGEFTCEIDEPDRHDGGQADGGDDVLRDDRIIRVLVERNDELARGRDPRAARHPPSRTLEQGAERAHHRLQVDGKAEAAQASGGGARCARERSAAAAHRKRRFTQRCADARTAPTGGAQRALPAAHRELFHRADRSLDTSRRGGGVAAERRPLQQPRLSPWLERGR